MIYAHKKVSHRKSANNFRHTQYFYYIFHIHLVLNHCIYSLIVMELAVRPYAVPMNLICIYDYSIAAIFPSDGFPPNK